MSSPEALGRVTLAAFDAAPLATAFFRRETSKELVFLQGNNEFDALIRGSGNLDQGRQQSGSNLDRLITALLSPASEPPIVAVRIGDHAQAFRPWTRSFTLAEDPTEYLAVQLVPLTEQESAERDLHSTIRQLKDLLDNSTALMYIKDLDGRYLLANHYYARRFGLSAESIVGLTDHDLFAEPIADSYTKNDDLVLRTSTAIEVEEPLATLKTQTRTAVGSPSSFLSSTTRALHTLWARSPPTSLIESEPRGLQEKLCMRQNGPTGRRMNSCPA